MSEPKYRVVRGMKIYGGYSKQPEITNETNSQPEDSDLQILIEKINTFEDHLKSLLSLLKKREEMYEQKQQEKPILSYLKYLYS